ncbi:MAG: DUF3783 domain-containing protein [Clostridiales bacterium]|nr:DUF3783 domain-containing protein [Clostridiales bacterium]
MKARVRTAVPQRVLTYLLEEPAAQGLSAILQGMKLEERRISAEELGQEIGYLAGLSGYEEKPAPEPAPTSGEGVMVMCGLSEARMDALLKALHDGNIRIPLKAVVTPTNQNWSFVKLAEELARERRAIQRGGRA